MFVAFEGIDGSGKTTLARKVSEKLVLRGLKVFTTHEPTRKSVIDDKLVKRRDVVSYLKLFFAFTQDRYTHQFKIKRHLDDGEVVICDRYLLSSYAYQGNVIQALFNGPQEAIKWMRDVSSIITVRPDIIFLLDIDPEEAIHRLKRRGVITPFETANFLTSVRKLYLSIEEDTIVRINASEPIETITEDIVSIIESRLKQL